jgi:hypothetical protein
MDHEAPSPVGLDPGLLECLVVAVPRARSAVVVAGALAELSGTGRVRVLDLVVVDVATPEGESRVLEVDDVDGLSGALLEPGLQTLLSGHDIALVASVLPQSHEALVIVLVESRWALPLSEAAHRVGGRVVGGERVVPVEATVAPQGRSRDERPDLLTRPPVARRGGTPPYLGLAIDPVDQLLALRELSDQGLLSPEELEHHRRRLLGP